LVVAPPSDWTLLFAAEPAAGRLNGALLMVVLPTKGGLMNSLFSRKPTPGESKKMPKPPRTEVLLSFHGS
jgi:hypothetical protein